MFKEMKKKKEGFLNTNRLESDKGKKPKKNIYLFLKKIIDCAKNENLAGIQKWNSIFKKKYPQEPPGKLLNLQEVDTGNTVLHYIKNVSIAKSLIELGANPNIENKKREVPRCSRDGISLLEKRNLVSQLEAKVRSGNMEAALHLGGIYQSGLRHGNIVLVKRNMKKAATFLELVLSRCNDEKIRKQAKEMLTDIRLLSGLVKDPTEAEIALYVPMIGMAKNIFLELFIPPTPKSQTQLMSIIEVLEAIISLIPNNYTHNKVLMHRLECFAKEYEKFLKPMIKFPDQYYVRKAEVALTQYIEKLDELASKIKLDGKKSNNMIISLKNLQSMLQRVIKT